MTSLTIQDLFSVEGKTVVITGGSRGIGLMMASAFIENGAKVYISSRKAEVCDAVAAELSKQGTCISVPADLSTQAGRELLLEAVNTQESKVDVLINNAGAAWGAPFEEYPESGYDRVMDLNVKSIFFLTQAFLPLLLESASFEDPARVINVGSIDGIWVSALQNSSYGVSKAAVHHMTKIMAVEFAGKFITVNAIAPGPFESKMTKFMIENAKDQMEKGNPMRRIGVPADMGGTAIFLSSKAGAYLNGTVIPVDGGVHIA